MYPRGKCPGCGNVRRLIAGNVERVRVCRGCTSSDLTRQLGKLVIINSVYKDEISGKSVEDLIREARGE